VLLVLSALTLWFFPAAFVIAIPILVVIFLVAFVAAVVTAVCKCPSTSWICGLAEAGSGIYGYYARPPDV
jgi:Ca2+/Na+ antiporter